MQNSNLVHQSQFFDAYQEVSQLSLSRLFNLKGKICLPPEHGRCLFSQVEGRILPQPHLRYRRPECMDVGTQGQWNLLDAQFYHGEEIKSWVLCSLLSHDAINIPGETGIGAFLSELVSCLSSNGVGLPRRDIPVHYGTDRAPAEELREAKRMAEQEYGSSPTIILVLLPGRGMKCLSMAYWMQCSYTGCCEGISSIVDPPLC